METGEKLNKCGMLTNQKHNKFISLFEIILRYKVALTSLKRTVKKMKIEITVSPMLFNKTILQHDMASGSL